MADEHDLVDRPFRAEHSSTHRQRLLLDSSDQPAGPSQRVAQPIPIPGASSALSVRLASDFEEPVLMFDQDYQWSLSFKNGRNLGMRPQVRKQDSGRHHRESVPRPNADLNEISQSGAAATKRRTYAMPSKDASRPIRRRRSGAGFEGSRPFKEPLTPRTHDNKTGTGRTQLTARRKDNPLSRYEHPSQEIVDISPTHSRHGPTTHDLSISSPEHNKRQKMNSGGRRRIKINADEESSEGDQTDKDVSGQNKLVGTNPIEIESEDETLQVRAEPTLEWHKSVTHLHASPTARANTRPLSERKPKDPKIVIKKQTRPSDILEYPTSDEDSGDQPQVSESRSLSRADTRPSPIKSPYFAANNARQKQNGTAPRVASSITGSLPAASLKNAFALINTAKSSIEASSVVSRNFYSFRLLGTGGQIQSSRKGWQMFVSEDGFKFRNQDGVERSGAEISSDNVVHWLFLDDIGSLSIHCKRPIEVYGSVTLIFITLQDDEIHRFTQMLQSWSTSHPLFKKLIEGDKGWQQKSRSSYHSLQALFETSEGNSPSKDETAAHLSPMLSPDLSARSADGSVGLLDGLKSTRTALEAAYREKRPTPISLPKGRDQSGNDERQLLVDDREVRTESDPGASSLKSFARPRNTRLAARNAEQKIMRDVRASEPLLVYPNIKGQTSVTLYEEDLDRLAPDEFLNDSIVEFYLRYNYDNLREEQRESAHVFNTFFYQRLTTSKDKEENFNAVKKWTSKGKGVDIFSKKFLVIPINENLHWYLTVVVNLDKVVFGPDVIRAPEASFVEAEDDTNTLGSSSPEFDTSNVLGDLGEPSIRIDSPTPPNLTTLRRDSVSPTRERASQPASIISQTPSVEIAEVVSGQQDQFDFCEESKDPPSPAELSLTEQIRVGELAKYPHFRQKSRSRASEAQAMQDLTLEDSDMKSVKETSRTYGKSKRGRPKQTGPGYSKAGKHIATDTPTIIILDSLNNSHNRVHEIIKDYLVREAQDKKGQILSPKQFATCKADLPRQDNFSDCGLFLIQYAQTLLSQPNVVPQLLNRVKFPSQSASEAHKRAFKNMFEIDRIPLRRKEMIEQLQALSIPYRKQAKLDEEQRKHDRAVARAQRAAEEDDASKDEEKVSSEADLSCNVLPSEPETVSKEASKEIVQHERSITIPPHRALYRPEEHEDSIDDLVC